MYMTVLPYVSCANKKTEDIVMTKNKHLTDAERLQIEHEASEIQASGA